MQAILSALIAAATASVLYSPLQWTQFRLHNDNNAVLPGRLSTSWRLNTGGGFSSSPALAGATLYIGNNAGRLYAIDPRRGAVLWTATVDNPLMSAPIVVGDLVIVGEGNENSPSGSTPSHPIRVGAPPSALLAFSRRSGSLIWRVPLRGSGMPTPALIGGVLLHHDGSGDAVAVNPATGALLYRREIGSIASMSSIVPLGTAAFLTQGVDPNAVYALRTSNASVLWRTTFSPVASGIGDCPSAADAQRAYCDYVMPPTSATPVQTERTAHFRVFALDLRTGKKVWDNELDRGVLPKRNEAAIPLVVNDTLYVGSSLRNVVHALDTATGRLRWIAFTRGPVKGSMVQSGAVLYFGDLGGYLWAVSASTGKVIGDRSVRMPFNVGSPLIAGQTLIIGSRGGTLLAVPLAWIRSGHDR